MEHSDKMIVIPIENQIIFNKENYKKYLIVALKLADIKAYDENFYMLIDNKYNNTTNIIDYIENLFNYKNTNLKYFKQFIELVYKAQINIDLILNQEIKDELIKFHDNSKVLYTKISPIIQKVNKKTKIKWYTD